MTEYNLKLFQKAKASMWSTATGTMAGMPIDKDFATNEEKYGWESQEKFIENEYGPEKLKRGRWRIILDEPDDLHTVWHQCDKADWDMVEVCYSNYSEWVEQAILPKWRCGGCNASPPDSIVTIWCLMEPDFTTELVKDTMTYEEEEEEDYANVPVMVDWNAMPSLEKWKEMIR